MLPEQFNCPHCSTTLCLEEPERQTKQFTCPHCQQAVDLRQNFDHDKLVTVFVPRSEADRLSAVSLLSEAGVSAYCKGTIVQDLLGFGRLGTGFNAATGPVHVQVLEGELERAREVLSERFHLKPGDGSDTSAGGGSD